ncbi:MAG: hypothetical protein AAFP79_01350 [Pseudomonadota bacterium]
MTKTHQSLLWAAIIIAAALLVASLDLGTGASFGVIGGLSGAAWGSLSSNIDSKRGCAGGCLL